MHYRYAQVIYLIKLKRTDCKLVCRQLVRSFNYIAAYPNLFHNFAHILPMEQTVTIHGKEFGLYIPESEIFAAVKRIGEEINALSGQKDTLFVCLLNGSFVFAADLLREINFPAQISFVKVASYSGMESLGQQKTLIGLNEDVEGKNIVLVEDIIDSGNTMDSILAQLRSLGAADMRIASLLFKPGAFRQDYAIHHVGFRIPDAFVVGYGMDYDGHGRNLKHIYQLK
jgi:hypoxanthine phosphoribosyltransferase